MGEFVFVPEDVQRSVHPVTNNHFGAGRRERYIGAEQLDEPSIDRDGPIVIDRALFFHAEDVAQVDTVSRTMNV